MKRIVFLDFDGILNCRRFLRDHAAKSGSRIVAASAWRPEDHLDPARVARLNAIVADDFARVVVSSSWRCAFDLPRLRELLEGAGFVGEIIDRTPWLVGHGRHVEIRRWLEATVIAPDRFVILDDDQEAGVGFGSRYVFVPDGLEDEHVDRARRVLA